MPDEQDGAMAGTLAGGEGPRKIGLFGRIMGQKYQDNLKRDTRSAEELMQFLRTASENPGAFSPETVKLFVTALGKLGNKEVAGMFTQHFEQLDAKRDVERRQAMLPGHEPQSQQPQQPQQGGMAGALGAGAPQPEAAPDAAPGGMFSPMHKSQLLKLAMLAKQQDGQQGPQESPQGQPGLPQPPSEAGGPAGAAPAMPPNPAPAIQKASALGATGFNVPPPASVPPPVQPDGPGFFNSPAQRGANAAAAAGPGQRQEADIKTGAEVDLMKKQWAARREMYQGDPSFATLSPRQKTQAMAGQPITPETVRMIPGAGISDENDIGLDGKPIGQGKLGTRTMVGDQLLFIPGRAESQRVLTTTDRSGVTTANQFGGYTGQRPNGGSINGAQGYNPAFAPTVSSVSTEREVVLPSGDIETLHGNTQRRTSRMGVPLATGNLQTTPPAATPPAATPSTATPSNRPAPAATPAPAASYGHVMRSGRRVDVLPPKVRMDMELMGGPEGAINKTVEIIQGLHNDIGILSNPAVAKAIMMQADTRTGDIMTYLSGRYLQTLDPETKAKAETMAARVQGAMEHINTIRTALKATGFRGEDAFAAMIAQAGAGRLLQNPEVLRHTLETTLSTLKGQQNTIQATLRGGKPGASGGVTAPPQAANPMTAPPSALPEVTSEAQYNALPIGAKYKFKGQELVKK